ncbi:YpsA SLOG family protein [Demequina gelatinilytica]|uniref:YpsA SLOG family protein n=1 Tax=Demequina gelatinilytica TaxID=1638980 RepID=UPI0034E2F491
MWRPHRVGRRDMAPGLRLISGGQSGVDRAALEVAVELGIPSNGWCAAGVRGAGATGCRRSRRSPSR